MERQVESLFSDHTENKEVNAFSSIMCMKINELIP